MKDKHDKQKEAAAVVAKAKAVAMRHMDQLKVAKKLLNKAKNKENKAVQFADNLKAKVGQTEEAIQERTVAYAMAKARDKKAKMTRDHDDAALRHLTGPLQFATKRVKHLEAVLREVSKETIAQAAMRAAALAKAKKAANPNGAKKAKED